jgi:hypothetical protein
MDGQAVGWGILVLSVFIIEIDSTRTFLFLDGVVNYILMQFFIFEACNRCLVKIPPCPLGRTSFVTQTFRLVGNLKNLWHMLSGL